MLGDRSTLASFPVRLAYRTRFISFAAVAFFVVVILTRYRIPESWQLHAFATLTAVLWLATSMPIRWRQIFFERPFLFRKKAGGVAAFFYGGFLAFWLLAGAVSIFLLALFTLPLTRDGDVVVIDPGSLDYRWTVALMAGTILCGVILGKAASLFLNAKPARYAFLVLPLVVGLLYSAGVFGVSRVSHCLDRNGSEKDDCIPLADDEDFEGWFLKPEAASALMAPGDERREAADDVRQLLDGGKSCRADERRTLFNPPTACEAIGVLTNFFGSGAFSDVRQRLKTIFGRVPSAEEVRDVRKSVGKEIDKIETIRSRLSDACRQVGVSTEGGHYRSLRPEETVQSNASGTISSVLASMQEICPGKADDAAIRWATGDFEWKATCRKFGQIPSDIDPSVLYREAWSSLGCDGLVGPGACSGGNAPCHPVAAARSRLVSVEKDLEEIVRALQEMEGPLDDPDDAVEGGDDSPAAIRPGLLLHQYALVDGFFADQIRRLVDIFAIYGRDAVIGTMTGQPLEASDARMTRQAAERPCETSAADKVLDKRRIDWCEKSPWRSAVLVVASPNVLQGYVLSVYVVFLLLVFRQRDGGDPDRLTAWALQGQLTDSLHRGDGHEEAMTASESAEHAVLPAPEERLSLPLLGDQIVRTDPIAPGRDWRTRL